MVRRFSDMLRSLVPPDSETRAKLGKARGMVPAPLAGRIERLVRARRAKLGFTRIPYPIPSGIDAAPEMVSLSTDDVTTREEVGEVNSACLEHARRALFRAIAARPELFRDSIAPGIIGFPVVKEALALQLFAEEPVHVLLIGDPGTGKTVLLQGASELHPISSFGLGSGTSGAGLAVTVKGNDIRPGLLSLADKGLCCIDELNLMAKEDRAPLYSAMEKGFFTYDKAGHHFRFDARVRLLATANPAKTKFTGRTPEELRAELPFDAALLSRFHLLFIMRKPGKEEFLEITRRMVKGASAKPPLDAGLARDYVKHAAVLKVELPAGLEKDISALAESLKEREASFVQEVSPRTIVGLIRLAKASARMELRGAVEKRDIERARDVLLSSLTA